MSSSSIASELDPLLIEQALEDVLHSTSFRSSKQCQALLRYIVMHTLANEDNLLRERVIGANVFERPPDYDTGNDPVVRSRAAEIRKRLAQHYLREGDFQGCIRIDIPTGSYHAVFSSGGEPHAWQNSDKETAASERPPSELSTAIASPVPSFAETHASNTSAIPIKHTGRNFRNWAFVIGAFGILLIAAAGVFLSCRQVSLNKREFARFWAPVVQSPIPTVLYIGGNYSYRLSSSFLQRYRAEHNLENTGPEFFIDLRKGSMIDEGDLLPTNNLIGFGDVAATARIISTLARLGKKYDLRYGNDIAVTDIQSSPALLIGGFSNAWTLRIMSDLRFTLEKGDRIVDRQNKNKNWINRSYGADGFISEDDYVVISRLPQSQAGSFVITIASIDTYGNQAAADFLSDPERVGALLRKAPAGWDRKNLQIILHTSVVNNVPVSSNVEAVYFG